MLVLVVDDDEDYAQMIAHTLERDSHEVMITHTARAAVKAIAQKPPDLAVLDIMLPDHSGIELCDLLRSQRPDTPILFLSSMDRSSDIIDALNHGGDDYVTKPFHPGELAARVRALSRRSPLAAKRPSTPKHESKLAHGSIVVDVANQSASIAGIGLNCTRIEVELLGLLAQYPGQVLSHAFLSEQIWGYQNVDDATLLKGHVSSLRKKIRSAGADEDMIRTVHGVGYSLEPQKAA
jgi:two-component system response regulator MprA